jgi:hypothetical protein
MNDLMGSKAPGWLRIVGLLALLWNLIGVYFYLVHVDAIAGPAASASDEALTNLMPAWATACFAIGVFGGTIGSLGLLLLKRWARPFLLLSLLALLLEQGWYLLASGVPAAFGPSAVALPVTILVVAALLAWLADKGVKRGWLT